LEGGDGIWLGIVRMRSDSREAWEEKEDGISSACVAGDERIGVAGRKPGGDRWGVAWV
jgi:hypothetical protein